MEDFHEISVKETYLDYMIFAKNQFFANKKTIVVKCAKCKHFEPACTDYAC
jgi:hypothetical protein